MYVALSAKGPEKRTRSQDIWTTRGTYNTSLEQAFEARRAHEPEETAFERQLGKAELSL